MLVWYSLGVFGRVLLGSFSSCSHGVFVKFDDDFHMVLLYVDVE